MARDDIIKSSWVFYVLCELVVTWCIDTILTILSQWSTPITPRGLSVPKDRIELFRPPTETFREEQGKRMDGELTHDMVAVQAGGL